MKKKKYPAAPHLLIVGGGSLLGGIERKIAGRKNIHSTGWQDDVVRYLRASDSYVLPSLGEGMPNSLIEAMSCGLACVATRIGGITELIEDQSSGLLVAPGDVTELAKAIERFMLDRALMTRLGACARERAVDRCAIDVVCREYVLLYVRLSGQNGRENHP